MFDPDRRPPRTSNPGPAASAGRADYVALTGLIVEDKKSTAFFSGSRTEYNKVLGVGDKIANGTIREITAQSIVVERDGKRTTVAVGQTVPLDSKSAPAAAPANYADVASAPPPGGNAGGGGAASNEGSPGGGNAPAPNAGNPSAAGAPTGSGNPPPTAGKGPAANQEEILRRMMERRKQDLK